MIRVIDYAQMAGRVYKDEREFIFHDEFAAISFSQIDSSITGWRLMSDVADRPTPTNNFYAALFIKFDQGVATDALVSIRGTVLGKTHNLWVDFESWVSDVLGNGKSVRVPTYLAKAQRFYSNALHYVVSHFPTIHRLDLTGHSLGAALAQLIVAKHGINQKCVTFNAPGIGEMGLMSRMGPYITNINSIFGFINKIGKPVPGSSVIWVDVKDHEKEAEIMFKGFSKKLYDQSEALYNIADDLPIVGVADKIDTTAFAERMVTYMHSLSGLGKTKSYQGDVRKCEQENIVDHNFLQKLLFYKSNAMAEVYCHDAASLSDAAETIMAQHKIENIITALKARPRLAYSTISYGLPR